MAESIKAMKDLKQFSVDDEVAIGFRYQEGKSIAIDFNRCYGIEEEKYLGECSIVIKGWDSATATHMDADSNGNELPLTRVLGIIDIILSIEVSGSLLQLWVETLDGRYLLLKFRNAVAGFVFVEIE